MTCVPMPIYLVAPLASTPTICFFFQAEDGIRDLYVTGVQTCALPISADSGLGYLLQQSSLLLQTSRVFVVLAVFGVLGGVSDWLFRAKIGRASCRERV